VTVHDRGCVSGEARTIAVILDWRPLTSAAPARRGFVPSGPRPPKGIRSNLPEPDLTHSTHRNATSRCG
jgi:hypothetical protein